MNDHHPYTLRRVPISVMPATLARRITNEARCAIRVTDPQAPCDPPRSFWARAWYLAGPMNESMKDFTRTVWDSAVQCHIDDSRGDS